MEPKILEEIRKHYKNEVIEFDWEPVRNQPKRYGILYPIIGYIVSMLCISLMGLGVFMWLFLIAGGILFSVAFFVPMVSLESIKKKKRFQNVLITFQEKIFQVDSKIKFNQRLPIRR
jgi:hypothetical protein